MTFVVSTIGFEVFEKRLESLEAKACAQVFPHRSFTEEVMVLDSHFGKLGSGSNAYVTGGANKDQKWHVYSASAESADPVTPTARVYTMEMYRFSYASFETAGYNFKSMDLTSLVERVLACFQSNEFSVALYVNGNEPKDLGLDDDNLNVKGYSVEETKFEDLGEGCGSMAYYGFVRGGGCCRSPRSTLHTCWSETENEEE
ncbi:hypothetical protein M8C21_022484 [Ambrosia artemisiifolia]|uniref:Uncharacterized protein n=1 Tax=Ambrosia artemisiifolia TaxID=4212 RepID=A0AAD5D248_AMBAR|nr:hypothetical protein M8C21_022484 [Ambrosia artemisiifolia]